MNLIERINRLKRIDCFIRMQSTGTPKEFSQKLGISESTLYEELKLLKEEGADICFCHYRQTYVYQKPVKLIFKIESII